MTPNQAVRALSKKRAALKYAVMEAEEVTRRMALKAADRQSSGTASQADLDRAGHPYSRARPNSGYDPALINQGASRDGKPRFFRRGWRSSGPQFSSSSGGQVITKLWNVDPNAARLIGSPRMVDRPIREAVLKAVLPDRSKRLAAAVKKAMGG